MMSHTKDVLNDFFLSVTTTFQYVLALQMSVIDFMVNQLNKCDEPLKYSYGHYLS